MPVSLNCVVCDAQFWVRPSRIMKGAKYCSYACHQVGEGRKGGAARGAQMKAQSQGKAYPKIGSRHAHRVNAEKAIGRPLRRGEIVHHEDRNKLNPDPNNLVVTTQSEHVRLHIREMLQARREKHGY